MPSAMVRMASSGTGRPVASDVGYAAAFSACTPMILMSGVPARGTALDGHRDAGQQPAAADAISTVSTSGACSRISRPMVPCPAMMSAWSKGWMSTAPVAAANRSASASASSTLAPCKMTSAP